MVNITPRPLYPAKETTAPQSPSWRLEGEKKICCPRRDFLHFPCFLFALYPYVYLRVDCPDLCFRLVLHNTQSPNIHAPARCVFVFSCTLFVLYPCLFVLIILAFALCPYCTTHTTQNPCPGGIQSRKPSKRAITGVHVRLRGQCVVRRPRQYIDWAVSASWFVIK
jgi:hypothetical protein